MVARIIPDAGAGHPAQAAGQMPPGASLWLEEFRIIVGELNGVEMPR